MALPKHTERGAAEAPVTDLQEAIRRVQRGERVTIRGEGDRQVAALVPLDDLRRLAADDARRERAGTSAPSATCLRTKTRTISNAGLPPSSPKRAPNCAPSGTLTADDGRP